jgi:hypothetical protein
VIAAGSGPITHEWQIQLPSGDWQSLVDEPLPIACPASGMGFAFVSPVNAPTVSICVRDCPGIQRWPVRCVVSNSCGEVISDVATLTICAANFNCDANLNSADFFDFLVEFFGLTPVADFNQDGAINSQDFFDFLAAFFAGC